MLILGSHVIGRKYSLYNNIRIFFSIWKALEIKMFNVLLWEKIGTLIFFQVEKVNFVLL